MTFKRKPRPKRIVSAWLEPEEWLRVNDYARKRSLSRSGVIREAILNIIEGKVPEDVVRDPDRTFDVPAGQDAPVASYEPRRDVRAMMWLSAQGTRADVRLEAREWLQREGLPPDHYAVWAERNKIPMGVADLLKEV